MYPAMAMSLADQHRRELTRRPARLPAGQPPSRPRAFRGLPGFRVTWTRMSLTPAEAGRRRSWVLIVSATRAQ